MEGAEAQAAPPINNLLQPDLYNRLDAQARERTRVVNAQLDHRLKAQQSILAKYRLAAERCYRRERNMVITELTRISARLPAVSRIPDFRSKFFYGEGLHRSLSHSLPELRERKVRGIPEEKPEQPFCQRCFIHHLPTKRKYYRTAPSPPAFLARGRGDNVGETTDARLSSLPPLTDFPATDPKPDVTDVKLTPVGGGGKTDPAREDRVSSVPRNSSRLSCKSDRSDGERARNGNLSAGFSDEGGLSARKSPRRGGSKRSRTVPPLSQQNLRLAHSSPQLFHG